MLVSLGRSRPNSVQCFAKNTQIKTQWLHVLRLRTKLGHSSLLTNFKHSYLWNKSIGMTEFWKFVRLLSTQVCCWCCTMAFMKCFIISTRSSDFSISMHIHEISNLFNRVLIIDKQWLIFVWSSAKGFVLVRIDNDILNGWFYVFFIFD